MVLTIYEAPFSEAVQSILNNQKDIDQHLITGLDGSAKALMIAQLFQAEPKPMLITEVNEKAAAQLKMDLEQVIADYPILTFPSEESFVLKFSVSSNDHLLERIEALNLLVSNQPGIVVTTIAGFTQSLADPKVWQNAHLTLSLGDDWERDALVERLQQNGYKYDATVMAPGEYSVRGGIIDIYPLDQTSPVRLDFFDTELDSLRLFDPETQESIENIEKITISPATDIIFPIEDQQTLLPMLKKMAERYRDTFSDETEGKAWFKQYNEQLTLLESGEPLRYLMAYLALMESDGYSVVDYLSEQGMVVFSDYAKLQEHHRHINEENQFWIDQEIDKGNLLPNLTIHLSFETIVSQIEQSQLYFSMMQRGLQNKRFASVHHFAYRSMTPFFNQMPLVAEELRYHLQQKHLIQIVLNGKKEQQTIIDMLELHDVRPYVIQNNEPPIIGAVNIVSGSLSHGFELPQEQWVVMTEHELFDKKRRSTMRRRSTQLTNAERIKSYNELKVGDYVVHQDHGIGQYQGVETIEISGNHQDFIVINYRDSARVLIPIDKIHLIHKYVASEGKVPTLNKMGGADWQKTKSKVQSTVEDIADELIALYAKREQEKGFAFQPDTPEQKEFEDAFPYVETPDQLQATQEIKADMEKERPMDRLLVGDVGYGKTEVAMRAIFKAVMDGKQVAFLVPTTVLAQQHYNTLRERFEEWPFEIRMMSRFNTPKQQKEIIQEIKDGAVSIVIGTHRVLSKDIEFQDLGLLIVDEEQRFGVRHKERLKALKSEVDVLTLTATPIPRTLHMSMIGIRDLSVLETPPNNRFPVQTYVMEFDQGAVKSGIERELSRGGQVFYLHNHVDTINKRAAMVEALVPEARVAVAHGRLTENELETILVDFIQGEYDVLVTTTIIETGVDIPNANTLFIDNADRMGLSTLYQLRGRVGRTHRLAYAYLMYPPMKQLSEVSEKRLNAIREFTELGSGFKLAMRDLSIRGAGNLLGQQQSGFIDSVGYDMYTEMLQEAVNERLRPEKAKQTPKTQTTLKLSVNAYLPDNYIPESIQKISVYKQIQAIDSKESYNQIQDSLIDRFGEYPDEVAALLLVGLLRFYASESGFEFIQQKPRAVTLTMKEASTEHITGPDLFEAMQDIPLKAKVKIDKDQWVVTFDITRKDSNEWLKAVTDFVENIYHKLSQEKEHALR